MFETPLSGSDLPRLEATTGRGSEFRESIKPEGFQLALPTCLLGGNYRVRGNTHVYESIHYAQPWEGGLYAFDQIHLSWKLSLIFRRCLFFRVGAKTLFFFQTSLIHQVVTNRGECSRQCGLVVYSGLQLTPLFIKFAGVHQWNIMQKDLVEWVQVRRENWGLIRSASITNRLCPSWQT